MAKLLGLGLVCAAAFGAMPTATHAQAPAPIPLRLERAVPAESPTRDSVRLIAPCTPLADSLAWAAATLDAPAQIRGTPLWPRYPSELQRQGISGAVVFEYVIGADGRAEPCTVRVLSATHAAFVTPARDALLKQEFTPPRRGGLAVRQVVQQRMRFRADNPQHDGRLFP